MVTDKLNFHMVEKNWERNSYIQIKIQTYKPYAIQKYK